MHNTTYNKDYIEENRTKLLMWDALQTLKEAIGPVTLFLIYLCLQFDDHIISSIR